MRRWDPRLHMPGLSLTGTPGSGKDGLSPTSYFRAVCKPCHSDLDLTSFCLHCHPPVHLH